jgi:hypothetical protein
MARRDCDSCGVRELYIRPHVDAGKRRLVVDAQKALNYQRALAVFTRIVDEPASVPGRLSSMQFKLICMA